MVRTRAQKDQLVDDIRQMLESTSSLYLVNLTGLTSNQINELRASLRQRGARMRVVKNRLARRAAEGSPIAQLDNWLKGPTAVVYHPSEAVATAKALIDYVKDHPALKIKAGLIDRRDAVPGEQVRAIAELPSLDVMRAMLLGIITMPATQLVRLLNTPATQLAYLARQKAESGGSAGEEAGAAPAAEA